MAKTARIIAWSDPHCPFQSPEAVGFLLSVIRRHRKRLTHCVCLGDVFEGAAASKWNNEYTHDLVDEYEQGSALLREVAKAAGKAKCFWLLGNHDANLQAVARLDKGVRRVAHWSSSRWAGDFARWRQLPHIFSPAGALQVGQILFKHGYESNEEMEALKWVRMTGDHANRLVVGGHTHTPRKPSQLERTKKIHLPWWYCNTGTVGPLKPGWTERKDTHSWGPGVMWIEAKMGRACQPSRNWEAHLLTP